MARIAEAKPTKPGDVIDAHVHLFSLPLLKEMAERPETPKRFKQALKEGKWGRRQAETLPDMTAEEIAPWYVERLDGGRRRQGAHRLGAAGLPVHARLHLAPRTGTCTRCATSTRATRARPSCSSARWRRASAA